jgi:DNA polymerase-3 subunit epsilon
MNALGVATLGQLHYVVFDLETTGLSPEKDKIIQVAAIKLTGARVDDELWREVEGIDPWKPYRSSRMFNAFVDPQRSIPKLITKMTKITAAMVAGQPTIERILPEFLQFTGDRIFVAHNGLRFDMRHLEANARRMGDPMENMLCLDTLFLSRKLTPEKGAKHTLDDIIERHGIKPRPDRHNALIDVGQTAEALSKFIAILKEGGKDRLLLL